MNTRCEPAPLRKGGLDFDVTTFPAPQSPTGCKRRWSRPAIPVSTWMPKGQPYAFPKTKSCGSLSETQFGGGVNVICAQISSPWSKCFKGSRPFHLFPIPN